MEPPLPTPGIVENSEVMTDLNSSFAPSSTSHTQSTHFPRRQQRMSSEQVLRPSPNHDVPPDSALGQFSFAPAVQTTVVTTTTTTTTNFPPLVIPPPRSMNELDPKLYPLAATPTPEAIKKLVFNFGGKPTSFQEADNPSATLEKLHREEASLRAANGSLRTVRKFQTVPDSTTSSTLQPLDSISKSREGTVSPVSISEAAEAAKGQRSEGKKSRPTLQPPNATARGNFFQSYGRSLDGKSPATPDTDNNHPMLGRRRLRKTTVSSSTARKGQMNTSPTGYATQKQQATPQSLTPRHSTVAGYSSYKEPTPLERRTRQDGEREHEPGLLTGAVIPASSDNAMHVNTQTSGSSRSIPTPLPARLAIDSSVSQDLSLPSPSLSPVTAAANLQQQYDLNDTNTEFEGSSFQLSTSSSDESQVEQPTENISPENSHLPNNGSQLFRLPPGQPAPSMADLPAMFDFFEAVPDDFKSYVMYQLLRRCPKPALHFVADVVNPALKCDFLSLLPAELSLNIVKYLDVKAMCRASQVSKKWRHIINADEKAWKDLFDRDGYALPEEELQRAIVEGWGWQHPSGRDDWEQDISSSVVFKSDSESSMTSTSTIGPTPATSSDSLYPATGSGRRPKRKATSKLLSRKHQKRKEIVVDDSIQLESNFMDKMTTAEGPYAAATAAALAVPYPSVGLPSLKSLHLYKSLYRRHHQIRRGWMKDDVKPRHIAFRAHDRHVVTCLQFDTDKILTGSDDTNINVYDTKTGALRTRLQGHEGGVWALQYEGNVLVSGSTDRTVRVWDIGKGRCMQVFHGHTSTVRCLQIVMPTTIGRTTESKPVMMPKHPLIITGSRDSNLRVWRLPQEGDANYFQAGPPQDDADCPYFVRILSGHQHSVRAIAAHADTLVSGSYDCTVRVWKISTGETVHRLAGHTQKVYSVVLDHNRNRCISGSMDNLVKIWSLDTGSVLYNLDGHTSLVGLLDLNSDRLVSAAADSTLRIWDPGNGQCKSTLTAHTGAITCFQHDAQKVISGSDRTLKMWNIKNGECVKDLLTDLSGVWQVKFNERRCVAAVQRNNLTYIEVLDFGASRDGVPEEKRGKRVVVNQRGQEFNDSPDAIVDIDDDD